MASAALPSRDLDASAPPSVVDPGGSNLADEQAGRYAGSRLLGQGGMGEVRLVRDVRIGREVAFKVMRSDRAGAEDAFRFLREARVQGQLEHPAIAPVYDLGRHEDGALFFTMKRVRGRTMKEIIAALAAGDAETAQAFGPRKRLQAFSSVCQAVEFAHSRGVLHRDLKPSNVMLGEFGEVTVLDWGLAKVMSAGASASPPEEPPVVAPALAATGGSAVSHVRPAGAEGVVPASDYTRTAEGSVLGTPGYMAPEQGYGRVDDLDARADVYALGAILFELLTLKPLHPRDSHEALFTSMIEGVDARPSARFPERDVPPEFDAICARAAARAPEDRYPSVRALYEDVERYLDGDRDLERRRQLAEGHAARAKDLAARALAATGPSTEDRAEAMREVGRALALDPENQDALRSLVELLVEPPREMPAEAKSALDAAAAQQLRQNSRDAAANCFGGLLLVPLYYFMGIHDHAFFAVFAVGMVLATAGYYFLLRRIDVPSQIVQFIGSTVALALFCRMFGPLLLLPTVMSVQASGYAVSPHRQLRWLFAAGCALGVAVPTALELLGVIEPSYVFRDGMMIIVPRMLELPRGMTLLVLASFMPVLVLMPMRTIGRARDVLWDLQQRLVLQAWHLRHLVPEEAKGAIAGRRG